jgi:hypothetical protein
MVVGSARGGATVVLTGTNHEGETVKAALQQATDAFTTVRDLVDDLVVLQRKLLLDSNGAAAA